MVWWLLLKMFNIQSDWDSKWKATFKPVGEMVTKDRESYQYLVESIRKFPNQNKFETMIQNAGFKFVTHRNFTNGVVAIT